MKYDELKDEIKAAMKAKDKVRLSILRQVHGEIKNIEVNERRDITDADVDAMLKRLIKQTKETLDGSIKAGNDQERTDTLTAQVAILESYLPKQVSGDELAALIDEVLTETGASSKKDMGRVMGALTQKTGGNFDKAAAAKERARKEKLARAEKEKAAREAEQRKSRRPSQTASAKRTTVAPVTGNFGKMRGKLTMPTKGKIVAKFGQKREGAASDLAWRGLLISGRMGQDVVATAGGTVVFADWMRGFGNLMILDHGSNYLSVYANNESLYKSVGDTVKQGETIASVGRSGGEDSPGLYFELRYKGKPFDPARWIAQ